MNHLRGLLLMWRSSGASWEEPEGAAPAHTRSGILDNVLQVMIFHDHIGKGWIVDTVNQELCLLTPLPLHHDRPDQHPHYCK